MGASGATGLGHGTTTPVTGRRGRRRHDSADTGKRGRPGQRGWATGQRPVSRGAVANTGTTVQTRDDGGDRGNGAGPRDDGPCHGALWQTPAQRCRHGTTGATGATGLGHGTMARVTGRCGRHRDDVSARRSGGVRGNGAGPRDDDPCHGAVWQTPAQLQRFGTARQTDHGTLTGHPAQQPARRVSSPFPVQHPGTPRHPDTARCPGHRLVVPEIPGCLPGGRDKIPLSFQQNRCDGQHENQEPERRLDRRPSRGCRGSRRLPPPGCSGERRHARRRRGRCRQGQMWWQGSLQENCEKVQMCLHPARPHDA